MPRFASQGIQLHYVVAGPAQGRPIVLVHGFASDYQLNWVGTRWEETLTGAGWKVLGLDCRGHGHSDKPHDPGAYARSTMAADAVALLDHLGLERASYLGYSMGARIGLEAVMAHPNRWERAVLGGIGSAQSRGGAELIARRLRGEPVEDPRAEEFYRFAAARASNDLEALACCILGPDGPPAAERLATIERPVLIAAGDRDPIARGARELAAAIPGAGFVPIPGRDHLTAVPARAFKDAALAFLADG
jgi:pimeloyl-ACP methyl ester carboxylesterase